jgi:hypothetical protein
MTKFLERAVEAARALPPEMQEAYVTRTYRRRHGQPSGRIYRSDSLKQGTRARYTVNDERRAPLRRQLLSSGKERN